MYSKVVIPILYNCKWKKIKCPKNKITPTFNAQATPIIQIKCTTTESSLVALPSSFASYSSTKALVTVYISAREKVAQISLKK